MLAREEVREKVPTLAIPVPATKGAARMEDPFSSSFFCCFSVTLCLCGEFSFFGGSSLQRTQSRRSRSTPAAAAEWGSSVSLASMMAQNSPRRVAAASAANNNEVRPEEAGPQISVRHPRGRPPVRASRAWMPLETISGAGLMERREAGTTLDGRIFAAGRLLASSFARPDPSTPPHEPGSERTSPSASSSKTKGRPRAAEVETTAEDIRFLGRFQGTPGLEPSEALSLFIRLWRLCFSAVGLSRALWIDLYEPSDVPRSPETELIRIRKKMGAIFSSGTLGRR